ncbi:MAG: PHP domain-containing protein [Armatimonadota bacterium]
MVDLIDNSGKADLHVHTTASDGTATPTQVVEMAAKIGLGAIGIADHDTMGGIRESLNAGIQNNIVVVPAVEINTDFGKHELHILGYFIDPDSTYLHEKLDYLRSERMTRGIRIVERLNQIGLKISMDRVNEIADGAVIGRPHIGRAIVEAGYAGSLNSAFGKYLVQGTPGFIDRYKLTPVDAIQIVRASHGVPIMAHPAKTHDDEIISELVAAGLQGFEAYHTDHTSQQRRRYIKMAKKYNLLVTGGSDYHGPDNMKDIEIGNVVCDFAVVEQLRELAEGKF